MKQLMPILIVLVSLLLALPLLRPGLPVADDWVNMALRATAFHQGFLDGQLPVRVLPHLYEGYGYPVTNFLYPVPFYLAEVMILAGQTPLMAVKLLAIAGYVLGNVGMARCMRVLTKSKRWGWWFSLLWVLEPYRLISLYQRGALGEILLLGLLPWILYLLSRRIDSFRHIIGLGLLIGLLPGLHNSLALLAGLVIITFWVTRPLRTRISLLQLAGSLVVAAITSAWFVVPALVELSSTQVPSIVISTVSDHFTPLLVSLPLILQAVGIVLVESRLRQRLFGVVTLLLALLLLPVFEPLWQIFALDKLLQFPFRLVPIVSLMLLIGVARMSTSRRETLAKVASMVVLLGFLQFSWPRWQPITQDYLDTNFHSSNTHHEFAPLKASRPSIPKSEHAFWFESPDHRVLLTDGGFSSLFIQAVVPSDAILTFARYDFPGWRVSVDGETVAHRIDQHGLIQVVVPASTHSNGLRDIRLELTPTPIQHLSTMISLLAFVSIALVFVPINKMISRVSMVSLCVGMLYFGHHLITNAQILRTRYDPTMMEQKYLASQWVDPRSQQPLGDSGLYAHAGWQYTFGLNPILINAEMPPLGKYIIGWLLRIFQNQAIVGLIGTSFGLVSVWALASWVFRSKLIGALPVGILLTQPIIVSSSLTTMLDSWQLGWLSLGLLAVSRARFSSRPVSWMLLVGLAAGGVVTTKFYLTGVLAMVALTFYCLLFARQLSKYLPLSWGVFGFVHLSSYLVYFLHGHSIRDYLGVQKYIYEFYRQGSPGVPLLSYWGLVFLNQWRVWWGAAWGQTRVLSASEWSVWWPIATLATMVTGLRYGFKRLRGQKIDPVMNRLLAPGVWLAIFGALLSVIGGWPHYFILFLPFALFSIPYLLGRFEQYWRSA